MNAKAVRAARILNRLAGQLGRRGGDKPRKVPRVLKRHYAKLDHRARGRLRGLWEKAIARGKELAAQARARAVPA